MNKKKYIIWDWNGTLLDDVDVCFDAINYLLHSEQLPLLKNKEEYQRVFRFPIIEYYKDVGFDFNQRSFQSLAEMYMKYYQPKSLQCTLHEGVEKTLKACHDLGYTQVVLSASKKDFLMEQVSLYNILPYFDDILGLNDIQAYSKAQLAKDFVADIQKEAASITFFGDSVHDFEVATYAGAQCGLIANGHEHKEKLIHTGCRVFERIEDIITSLTIV